LGYEPGTPVPEALTVVSSQDGDSEQRRVSTDEKRLEREGKLRVITNKHNPARAGTEQPADLIAVFRLTNLEALQDFIFSAPEILSKSATATKIRGGFLEASFINNKSFSFLDIDQIIYGTTRRAILQEEYANVLKTFALLYLYAAKDGHVLDDVFVAHGIPCDTDMYGKEVRREAGISNESCQRAKCLSHKYVQQQR
jgi:hypothetical protein